MYSSFPQFFFFFKFNVVLEFCTELYIIVQNAFNSLDAVPYKVLPFRCSRSGLCSVHEPLERKHF